MRGLITKCSTAHEWLAGWHLTSASLQRGRLVDEYADAPFGPVHDALPSPHQRKNVIPASGANYARPALSVGD